MQQKHCHSYPNQIMIICKHLQIIMHKRNKLVLWDIEIYFYYYDHDDDNHDDNHDDDDAKEYKENRENCSKTAFIN